MNNWKVIFATVIIFGTGVITGGLLVNYVEQHPRPKAVRHAVASTEPHAAATNQVVKPADNSKSRPPEVLSKQFLQRLDEELHLTTEQHEAIQKIIGTGQDQMRKVIQDARLEIRDVLTPKQRKEFDDLMKRQFRKTLFGTNVPTTNLSAPAQLAPEEQVILIEKQRDKTRSALRQGELIPPLPPPPAATNQPAVGR